MIGSPTFNRSESSEAELASRAFFTDDFQSSDILKESVMQLPLEIDFREMRGDVKTHTAPLHGTVLRLVPNEDHGFIGTSDGREIYFSRNAVLNDAFGELSLGTEVRFAEEAGEKGPQASTVRVVGRHHHLDPVD